jgi:hypothetical protein
VSSSDPAGAWREAATSDADTFLRTGKCLTMINRIETEDGVPLLTAQ